MAAAPPNAAALLQTARGETLAARCRTLLYLARIETPCNPHDIPYTTPPAVGSGGVHHNNPPESEWRLQEKTKPGTPNQTKPFPRLTLALAIIT